MYHQNRYHNLKARNHHIDLHLFLKDSNYLISLRVVFPNHTLGIIFASVYRMEGSLETI